MSGRSNRWLAVVAAGVLTAFGCQDASGKDAGPAAAAQTPKPPSTDPSAEDYVLPPLPHAKVTLNDVYGGQHVVDVEVAATDVSRERGLMWRKELAPGKGMLFIFTESRVNNFWMRNTLIPLDMLFISESGEVVGIVRNAEPRTLSGRSVNRPSKYVLEVPGGWTEKVGIEPGAKATFQGISMIEVE